jgi:hypothetical protein
MSAQSRQFTLPPALPFLRRQNETASDIGGCGGDPNLVNLLALLRLLEGFIVASSQQNLVVWRC